MFGCERAAYILFQLGTLQVGCKFCPFFKTDLNSCSQLQNKNVSFSAFHSIFNFLELGRELKHQKFNEIKMYLRNALILLKLNFLAVRDFW